MADAHARLRDKLCRELAQSEHDAALHTRREARRLGDVPPARALLAIADHADQVNVDLAAIVGARQPVGLRLGRAVGSLFSGLRHFLFDRMIAAERSYRATLLGLRHGLDVARFLREVALVGGDRELLQLCGVILVDRGCLLEDAEHALAWFAVNPEVALRSGARLMLADAETTAVRDSSTTIDVLRP